MLSPSIEALHTRGLLDELEVPRCFEHPFQRQAGHFAGIPIQQDDVDAS
jgi:hypothetical protein